MKSTGSFADWIPRSYSNIEAKFGARIAPIHASRIMSLESKCKFRNWIPNAKNMAAKGPKILFSKSPEVYGRSPASPRLISPIPSRVDSEFVHTL